MAQNVQPISDDQELAKVLAGVNQEANEAATKPAAATDTAATSAAPADDTPAPADEPEQPVAEEPAAPAPSGDLEAIKKDALNDLRPLVDKLNVAPEEKFDTYLLLLRSTDDQTLIPSAYEAARSISDEARRAQALLDTIKEIDYLSNPQQAQQ